MQRLTLALFGGLCAACLAALVALAVMVAATLGRVI